MQLPKIEGGQRKLRGGQPRKTRAVVWQWVVTFKEAVPPGTISERYIARPSRRFRRHDAVISADERRTAGRTSPPQPTDRPTDRLIRQVFRAWTLCTAFLDDLTQYSISSVSFLLA